MQTTEQASNRNEDGTFPSGVSGNPGGRPKVKRWRQAIEAALGRNPTGEPNFERTEAIAEALVIAAMAGDLQAIKEIGDRIDGKVPQALVGGDDDSAPIRLLTNSDTDIIARYQQVTNPEKP